MSTLRLYKKWMPFLFMLLPFVISLACNATANVTDTPESLPSETATSEPYPEELVIERDIAFGPGSFIYTDTQAGLGELSSYKATLTLAFDGTLNGQPETWSKTYVMLATNAPQARQWTIETTSGTSHLLASINGMEYEQSSEDGCLATEISEKNSLTEEMELASFLTGVIGAEQAGAESINEVAANHYTFDQRALGQDGLAESTGELWVASEGDYLVKYLLTTRANSDYFGEGKEGTLTWDYQLSDVNAPLTITLPDDCPPGLVDAPLLPDAGNVVNSGGMLAYDTSSTLADATAFYQEQIPGLGWTPKEESAVTDAEAFLNFAKDTETMTVIISTVDTHTEVRILISPSQP